jgi:adenylate cyclase
MFLDMKSSTAIAEKIGNERFYTLLNELFHEISQPVQQTKAEIYQYVGDQVLLTWEMDDGVEEANCLKAFFLFRKRLNANAADYEKRFGVIPEFKAGLHFGKVISAQIGDLKREIVYNGDVMNTAARIQSECNKYQRDFLASGMMIDRLKHLRGFHFERIETVTLRGKDKGIELYAITVA